MFDNQKMSGIIVNEHLFKRNHIKFFIVKEKKSEGLYCGSKKNCNR